MRNLLAWPVPFGLSLMALVIWTGLIALAIAQDPVSVPNLPQQPRSSAWPDGWPSLVGAVVMAFSAAATAYINVLPNLFKRRAEDAEKSLSELKTEYNDLKKEYKQTLKELDLWKDRAYAAGYDSGDNHPSIPK